MKHDDSYADAPNPPSRPIRLIPVVKSRPPAIDSPLLMKFRRGQLKIVLDGPRNAARRRIA